MATGETDGKERLGWVDGLAEQVRGQREGAEVLKHVVDVGFFQSIDLKDNNPL